MCWRAITILLLFSLQSCATQPPQTLTVTPAPVAVVIPVSAPVPKKAHVVIIVSENIPAYSDVAKSLSKLLGQRGSVQYLTSSALTNINIINQLKKQDDIQLVSIGLNASIAAKPLADKQMIFCQVYNYQDYDLISTNHKGVSMLPSLQQTFSTWNALSARTKNIGVISGPDMEELIQAARVAAKPYGITLHHVTVNSDKEYQYAYKKLGKKVQGYWLLPDNRVLSENILRDVMNYSVRNSKQVAVFNDELLKLGGLMSISSDPQDIAQQVYARLEQAQGQDTIPGPDIVHLEKANLRINAVMARNLNLNIPSQYRKLSDAD